jgi:hypothetical protein
MKDGRTVLNRWVGKAVCCSTKHCSPHTPQGLMRRGHRSRWLTWQKSPHHWHRRLSSQRIGRRSSGGIGPYASRSCTADPTPERTALEFVWRRDTEDRIGAVAIEPSARKFWLTNMVASPTLYAESAVANNTTIRHKRMFVIWNSNWVFHRDGVFTSLEPSGAVTPRLVSAFVVRKQERECVCANKKRGGSADSVYPTSRKPRGDEGLYCTDLGGVVVGAVALSSKAA